MRMNVDQIRTLLRSKTTQDRMRAVELLDADEPEHVPLLLEALRDKSHYVCARSAAKLSESPPEDAAKALLVRFVELMAAGKAGDPGCAIRGHRAIALGKLRYH